MGRHKTNIPLAIGLLMFSVFLIVRTADLPDVLCNTLLIMALIFELWGIIRIARSPEIKNSKLRRWKWRLLGKEIKNDTERLI